MNSVATFLAVSPNHSELGLAGVWRCQKQMITRKLISGRNVRLGMEDSRSFHGELRGSNLKANEIAMSVVEISDREIAHPRVLDPGLAEVNGV